MTNAGRLLIIDDEPRMCDSLKALLANESYEIHTAYTGTDALDMLRTIEFDATLMDYVLPDIHGSQLMGKIREINPGGSLIVMTGYATIDKAVDALRQGAYDFIQKPFDTDELREKIKRAFQRCAPTAVARGGTVAPAPAPSVPIQPGEACQDTPTDTTIGSIAQDACSVTKDTSIEQVKQILKRDKPISSVVVAESGKPIGLVMSIHLDRALSHPYGLSLYLNRQVRKLMNRHPLVLPHDTSIAEAARLAMLRPGENLYDHLVITKAGNLLGTVSVRRMLDTLNRLQTERSAQLEQAYGNLQRALSQVKTLSGLVPICAHCKNIRDDKGYWNQLEEYIQKHSDAEFSHSICPDCIKKLYPDLELPD